MIKKKCYNSNWITNKHKEINADPILIEKAIYAFELLGNLIENGVHLPNEFNILNKLKVVSPESFYLWAVVAKMI